MRLFPRLLLSTTLIACCLFAARFSIGAEDSTASPTDTTNTSDPATAGVTPKTPSTPTDASAWERFIAAEVAGFEAWRIAVLFIAILGGMLVGRIARGMLQSAAGRLEKKSRFISAAALTALAQPACYAAMLVGVKLGIASLHVNERIDNFVQPSIKILATLLVGYAAYNLVAVVEKWLTRMASKTANKLDDMLVPLVRQSLRWTIVVLVIVQVATFLSGETPATLIAGLGVGGLALGLAAQDTIKNLFGSLMICGDHPFDLGDRIAFGDTDGTVERVGFRSTRIRNKEGHVVTVPNGELANRSIRNVSKRPFFRRRFTLGLVYSTPPDQIETAMELVREILADHEGMDPESPPRVYFDELADFSLNVVVMYWYHPADWWAYVEFSQHVNLEILRRFSAAGIELAFPTQTVELAGTDPPDSQS